MSVTAELHDGTRLEFPDGTDPAVIQATVKKMVAQPEAKPATTTQKVQASVPGRVLQGIRDPIDALAPIAPLVLGGITSGFGMVPNKLSDALFGEFDRVNAMNKQNEADYQGARQATTPNNLASLVTGQKPDPGFDLARLAGNVVSPANIVGARAAPAAAGSLVARVAAAAPKTAAVARGAALGTVGAATAPVNDATDASDFVEKKAAQLGIGAATGGAVAPIAGKIGDAIVRRLTKPGPNPAATMGADQVIADALAEVGQRAEDLPKQYMDGLRAQVVGALQNGRQLDAAALLRSSDFRTLGIPPTTGQITRDATQFATERNLRAATGVGAPLLARFDQQNRLLSAQMDGLGARNATEVTPASNLLHASLRDVDAGTKGVVDQAYAQARDHVGRAAPMDAAGFTQAANLALDDGMLGHYLPAETRAVLNGVAKGEIPFNVNTAVQIDSTLSAAQRAAGQGTPASLAIGKVRTALNGAKIADNVGEDAKAAFDAARGAARQRFGQHDEIPALKAAAEQSVSPDQFVQKFVLNGQPREVNALAAVLREQAPEAFQQTKNQLAAVLERAAFGENAAGDKLFHPESFQKALRNLGTEKLSAFFSPEEINRLQTMSRVGAYINATPTAAPVLGNPNMVWAAPLLERLPGANVLSGLASIGGNAMKARNALAAQIPEQAAPMTAEQMRKALLLRNAAGLAGGVAANQ